MHESRLGHSTVGVVIVACAMFVVSSSIERGRQRSINVLQSGAKYATSPPRLSKSYFGLSPH
jgi:hypothetical protein